MPLILTECQNCSIFPSLVIFLIISKSTAEAFLCLEKSFPSSFVTDCTVVVVNDSSNDKTPMLCSHIKRLLK